MLIKTMQPDQLLLYVNIIKDAIAKALSGNSDIFGNKGHFILILSHA